MGISMQHQLPNSRKIGDATYTISPLKALDGGFEFCSAFVKTSQEVSTSQDNQDAFNLELIGKLTSNEKIVSLFSKNGIIKKDGENFPITKDLELSNDLLSLFMFFVEVQSKCFLGEEVDNPIRV